MKKLSLFILIIPFILTCSESGTEIHFYQNPIIAGFYPDPSICRVDDDYYLVNSSFSYYPGVPIFHSTDLVNWKQIGHILNRPSQLNLDSLAVSQGIFAPTLRYNEGTYYMITTLIGRVWNFVVTSEKPEGPWSDPVQLPAVNGIDPSIFFDDDGKSYIVFNGSAPDNNPLYNGHRAIWLIEFNKSSLKTKGDKILLVNGGTKLEDKPIWIEGPHIFKHKNYYYLIAAQGGTGYDHSEVVFRSDKVTGPYIPWGGNPILTQRHLDPGRKNPVTNTGHADFVLTQNNEWWSVFLGCRPYEDNFYNTGRETFLARVNWTEDDWPYIEPYQKAVRYRDTVPNLKENKNKDFPKTGNFTLKDKFSHSELELYWTFLRTAHEKWYSLDNGSLKINLRPDNILERKNISMISRRQQHAHCVSTAEMIFTPKNANEIAGLTAFQNEKFFYLLGKTIINGETALGVFTYDKENQRIKLLASENTNGPQQTLRIEINGATCNFAFQEYGKGWNYILKDADAKILSTDIAGGFVGTMLGMYASSNGTESDNTATFNWYEYQGNDPVFNKE